MKTSIPFFIVVFLLLAGCIKPNSSAPTVVLPSGKFSGTFTRYHLSSATNKVDTAIANIILTMSATSGFAVTGDTTKVHAGSHGSYASDGTYLEFSDLTLPTSATTATPAPVKSHLNGIYQYNYTAGSTLQLYSAGDTLIYYYNLAATP